MPVAKDVRLGAGVVIHQPELVNLYGCTIGDETAIGAFVEIQKGAAIGRACKISSHSFICEGVTIADEVFIGHGVMFINDRRPRAAKDGKRLGASDWAVVPTSVGRGASIGSGAVILCGVAIGAGALVGAGAVVTHDVAPGATVAGVPARPLAAPGEAPLPREPAPSAERPAEDGGTIRAGDIRIGLAGYGYWGPNLARNFAAIEGAAVAAIADPLANRRAAAAKAHPRARLAASAAELIADPTLDAVVLATPPATHAPLAAAALAAGKHVLVEKPLAPSSAAAARLGELAARAGRVLMVDHPHVYAPAVRALRKLVAEGEIGAPLFADAMRTNLARFDPGIGVLEDLAVHDLAILDFVLGESPRAVSAVARAHAPGESENLALLTLHYAGPLVAQVHANWLSPVKVRRFVLGGTLKLASFDDVEPAAKLAIHDRALFADPEAPLAHALRTGYRSGDARVPRLDATEPLRAMAEHFLDCIRGVASPITGASAARRVLAVVEAARRSISAGGAPEPVAPLVEA